LRHETGTKIDHEFGIEAAQVVLGHTKPDETALYAERNRAKARQIMGKIG